MPLQNGAAIVVSEAPMSCFRITNTAADLWIVEQEVVTRPFLFQKTKWKEIGAVRTEKAALEIVKANANFKPHTSYYDRYGNKIIASCGW